MGFLLAGAGQYGVILALVAGLLVTVATWRGVDVSKQRAIGAERAVAQIQKATHEAVQKADTAARKSAAAPVPRRVRSDKLPDGYRND